MLTLPRVARSQVVLAWLVVGVIVLSGCGSDDGTASQELASQPDFFGVNGDVLFVRVLDGEGAAIEPALRSIEESSLSFVRSSIDWRRLQPTDPRSPGSEPDFAVHDAWVAALASHGLRWEPTMLGWPVPPWAGDPELVSECGSRAPPADPASYGGLAELMVERYGRDGSFWTDHPKLSYLPVRTFEIWNEPNHFAFWCPEPDPARFAKLAVTAALAIHAADPAAEVLLGGLAGFDKSDPHGQTLAPLDFLAQAIGSEPSLPSMIDAVGLHPYAPDPNTVLQVIESFRAGTERLNLDSTPLAINEIGWPTQGRSGFTIVSNEAVRAEFMIELATDIYLAKDILGVRSLAPYSWVTKEADPADSEDWFGLAHPVTGAPYAAGRAYGGAVQQLSSPP